MQILEIVLYGNNGKKRTINFTPGKTNIIVGDSQTGKTSLIDIVNYCLGRDSCNIAEGVIREYVKWFGLLLQFNGGQVFLARENPGPGKQTTNRMYYELGENVNTPQEAPDESNTTADDIIQLLTDKIGISSNLNIPPQGQTRAALAANIKHALVFCFQEQEEIARKKTLFHNQDDNWVAQATKDTFPYFLGAIQEDRLALEQELNRARRELRLAEKALKDAESIKGDGVGKAISLIEEARGVGLLTEVGQMNLLLLPEREITGILRSVLSWTPQQAPNFASDRLVQLQSEYQELQDRLEHQDAVLRDAKTFAQEAEGFSGEVLQQQLRLESIGLYEEYEHSNLCPVCAHGCDSANKISHAIKGALEDIRRNLDDYIRERPRLREYINNLENERQAIIEELKHKRDSIEALIKERDVARTIRDLNARQSRVVGRISLWLESVNLTDDLSGLKRQLALAQANVEELEKKLDPEIKEEILNSILNRIGIQLTGWARMLELEHSKSPIRLDIKKLTVVADREDRPIPLFNMGSGENWVGYHIVTHLALHQFFRKNNRPVPGFLILDQPTQVYFPRELGEEDKKDTQNLEDKDRLAVNRLFNLVFDVVESLAPNFQVIVVEHAELNNARFQADIVARWRNKRDALVPYEWIIKQDLESPV